MITYDQSQLVDKDSFGAARTFKGIPAYDTPGKEHGYILPLEIPRSTDLAVRAREFAPRRMLNIEKYYVSSEVSLWGDEWEQDGTAWLASLGIDDLEEVYLSFFFDECVIMEWKTFRACWSDIWSPFIPFAVFDDSLEWAVLLGTEEWAVYAREAKGRVRKPGETWGAGLMHYGPCPPGDHSETLWPNDGPIR